MNKIEKLIKEYIGRTEYNDDVLEKIYNAAMTQRGNPESTMMRVQGKFGDLGVPNIISTGIEHYGDLSHRAQKTDAVGNVWEKLTMDISRIIIEKNPRRMSYEDEIYNGIESNIRYYHSGKTEEEKKQIHFDIMDGAFKLLREYIISHQKYNEPLTEAGRRGKSAAINFAKYTQMILEYEETMKSIFYSDFLDDVNWLKDWLKRLDSASEENDWYNIFIEGYEDE